MGDELMSLLWEQGRQEVLEGLTGCCPSGQRSAASRERLAGL